MTRLGYKRMDDWYKVTQEDFHEGGGATLLNYYNGSPFLALQTIYPEHKWELEQFKTNQRDSPGKVQRIRASWAKFLSNLRTSHNLEQSGTLICN